MRGSLILILACLGLCGAIDANFPSRSFADQQKEVVGWQYATVRAVSKVSQPEWLWFYADGRLLKFDSWAGLLSALEPQHLLVSGVNTRVNEVTAQGAVLDHLGRQGWELAGVTARSMTNYEGETRGKSEQWVFKRRR